MKKVSDLLGIEIIDFKEFQDSPQIYSQANREARVLPIPDKLAATENIESASATFEDAIKIDNTFELNEITKDAQFVNSRSVPAPLDIYGFFSVSPTI